MNKEEKDLTDKTNLRENFEEDESNRWEGKMTFFLAKDFCVKRT